MNHIGLHPTPFEQGLDIGQAVGVIANVHMALFRTTVVNLRGISAFADTETPRT